MHAPPYKVWLQMVQHAIKGIVRVEKDKFGNMDSKCVDVLCPVNQCGYIRAMETSQTG